MIKENSAEPQKPRDNGDCAKYSFKQCGQYDGKPPSIPNCGKNDAPLPQDHQCSANTGGKICDADAPSWPDKKPEEPECNIKVTLCDGQAPGCPEQKPNCPSDDKEDYEHYIHYKEKNFTEGMPAGRAAPLLRPLPGFPARSDRPGSTRRAAASLRIRAACWRFAAESKTR